LAGLTTAPHAVFALLGFLLLVFVQPAVGDASGTPLWFPSAGIALVLVAWFGRRAALLPFAAALVPAIGALSSGNSTAQAFGILADGGAAALEALVGCWLFLGVARGARRLSDPRSAVEFVLLIPGLAAVTGAIARAGAAAACGASPTAVGVTALWLGHALGLLVVAPPLLVCVTPWLVRRGLTPEEPPDSAPLLPGPVGADGTTPGDAVEIAGLALCAGGLGLLLALAPGHRVLAGWQVWGAPLLLIVWASLRQGLAGGSCVAGVAVAVPLAVLTAERTKTPLGLLLPGNLLAQAGTGLLVAASASWLRSSERRYRQLVAHVPVVVYSVRVAGTPARAEVTLVSAASAALLGCPPERFLGDHRRWLEHVHPDDREVLLAAIAQLERQGDPVTCEYRLAPEVPANWQQEDEPAAPLGRNSGRTEPARPSRVRWLRDTLASQRDDDGRLIGWQGVVTDITEQRVLADDLRRTSSLLHGLVDNMPAGVFFVQGPQGRPVLVNARARQLLGQREDASLAQHSSVYRLHRPDGSEYPVDELPVSRALRHGRTVMCDDLVVYRPDGRRVPLVTWAASVKVNGTSQSAAVWVLEDLTALQQAEAARRESERRLRAVVDTMGNALVVLDRTGEIVDANPAAGELFGLEPGSVQRRKLSDAGGTWLREDDSPLAADELPWAVAQRTGRPVRGALLVLRRVDSLCAPRRVLVHAMPLSTPAVGVVVTLTDLNGNRPRHEIPVATEAPVGPAIAPVFDPASVY
jgi:PAS domain-containing protein/integral membrane sensor domain MASE1